MSNRRERLQVWYDTESRCLNDQLLKEAIEHSINHQQYILETDILPEINKNRYEEPVKIVVSKKRSFEAASAYSGEKVAVLNFASWTNPGGGVQAGSSAQEECLCRCSTLAPCISTQEAMQNYYEPHRKAKNPLHNDDIIYTPDVMVFKTDVDLPKFIGQSDWYRVDIISCAAPNLRDNPTNQYNPSDGNSVKLTDRELFEIQQKRIRRILESACLNEADVLILGAFGCGVFRNRPEIVAEAFRRVIKEFEHSFKIIEFAIYSGKNDSDNYKIFANKFRK